MLQELRKQSNEIYVQMTFPNLGLILWLLNFAAGMSISGLVVEYIVAIDVTGVRFPADACIA